jgi:hypothetical protein
MQPHLQTSGDAIADRRADYAKMLAKGGEPDAAAELMEQALELVPAWAAGWYRLATYRERAGNIGRDRGLSPDPRPQRKRHLRRRPQARLSRRHRHPRSAAEQLCRAPVR